MGGRKGEEGEGNRKIEETEGEMGGGSIAVGGRQVEVGI